MSKRRLYPDRPIVGVGVLIYENGRIVVVKREAQPDEGLWSIPGGIAELGELAADAAVREVQEETGLVVEVVKVLGVVDKIVKDIDSRIKYHFVIIYYLAKYKGGELEALDDAIEAKWIKVEEISQYQLSPTLKKLLTHDKIYQ
jgi:mutator protein MutT